MQYYFTTHLDKYNLCEWIISILNLCFTILLIALSDSFHTNPQVKTSGEYASRTQTQLYELEKELNFRDDERKKSMVQIIRLEAEVNAERFEIQRFKELLDASARIRDDLQKNISILKNENIALRKRINELLYK